ncbi:NtrZ family periplasmic regulatory protein [Brevundimonas sp. NPDC003935]|nr:MULTISPECIES: hypothetical protein [unclassified Brevundimonas]
MRFVAIIAATVGALAIAGTAHDASAQARRAPAVSLTEAAQTPHSTATPPRRGLRWNDSGRWGLNFNLNQPVGRETDWGDVEAGAYYRLSPRLRVGAAANLASPEVDPARAPESAADRRAAPRVRLETIFKF